MLTKVLLVFLPILKFTLSKNCPVHCQCLSDTDGKCIVQVQSSICLLSWGRLFVEINDWNLIDTDTFSMCRTLHYVSITGSIHYIDSELLRFPSTNITEMYIRNSLIKSLSNESFTSFIHVKNLFITSNRHLTTLSQYAFANLNQMYLLDLSFNAIEDVSKAFLAPLDNLKILKLNNNQITKIKKDTFKNLRTLRVLELQNNKIVLIDSFGFRGLENLVSLQLKFNSLFNFHYLELIEMSSINKIDLSYNRIKSLSLPSCPDTLKLINLVNNNLSMVPNIQQRRCLSLKKVLIKNNYIKECKSKSIESIFDLNICVKIPTKESWCTIIIIISLFILSISFFVPLCVFQYYKNFVTKDQDEKKKPIHKCFQWSMKRRLSNNTDDLFI